MQTEPRSYADLIDRALLNPVQKLIASSDFLNNISTGMLFRNSEGVIVDCNRAAETILGTPREELIGTTSTDVERSAVGLDGLPLANREPAALRVLRTGEAVSNLIAGINVGDNAQKWVSVKVWPAVVAGEVVGAFSAFDDVTRQVKERRFLEVLSGVNQVARLNLSEVETHQRICDILVSDGCFALAWVGVASSEGGVDIVCSSGASAYLYDNIVSWWGSRQSGLGPTGTALRTRTTQVANNLASQPLYGPWRDRAREFGLASSIALPIELDDRLIVVSIYDAYAEAFDELSVRGLETIAAEIGSCMTSLNSVHQREAALEESVAAQSALRQAELSREEAEQWFKTLVAKSSDLMVVVDDHARFIYTNPVVDRLFGYEPNSLIGRNIFDFMHPDDRALAEAAVVATLETGSTEHPVDIRFLAASGEWRWIEGTLANYLADPAIRGIVGNGHDVTERTYLTRALETLSEGTQVLVHAVDESSLLSDLCQTIVSAGGYPLAFVGFIDDESKRLNRVATAGIVEALEGLEFGWGDDELGSGPIGDTVRTGEVHIENDILHSGVIEPRRVRAERYGIRSGCSFPLRVQDELIGMVAIFSAQANYFGPSEVATLGELVDELAYGIGRLRDAERLASNEALIRESDERFRLAFDYNMAPMLFSDFEDRVIAVNDSFCRMVGFTREELLGHDSKQFTYPDDIGITEDSLVRLSSERADQLRYTKRYLRKDGRVLVSEVSRSAARDATGRIRYFVSSERDITEERALAAELSHQALHDALTGLANRALFEDRLAQAHARVLRHGGRGAVLLLDLDDFKGVNDAHGHLVGDQLLTGIARRFELVTRSTDTLSRFGGDEFLYLAENLASAQEAEDVAMRLIDVLAEPFAFNGLVLEQHASVGIVVFDETYRSSTDLIQRADVALYEAKRLNRGRTAVFTPSMQQQAVSHFELVQELRRAQQTGDLAMHYQPIVELETMGVVGFEALMRWQHPERGWVPPDVFIPLAEQTDLILELGTFALDQAIAAASSWPTSALGRSPYVSVNLSVHQFHDPALVGTIEAALARTGLEPGRLVIEITESALLLNVTETMNVMERISALGVGIALDDFGTGYSSLSYLALMHPTIIKIDQSFVSPVTDSERNDTLLEAIVSLGQKLGMTMSAEGIETPSQLKRLHRLGCEYGQGFLWSPAVPNGEVEAILLRSLDSRS